MTGEDDVKDAIQRAIQMEKDGYAFYMRAASQTSSDLGKEIFESIAKDEQKRFSDEIYYKLAPLSRALRKYAKISFDEKSIDMIISDPFKAMARIETEALNNRIVNRNPRIKICFFIFFILCRIN